MRPLRLAALLPLVGLLALPPATQAQTTQTRDIRLSGMGMRKCSEWLDWKEKGNGEARATTVEWAQGFFAGHNLFARVGRNPAPSVIADAKILLPLLDAYCEKNPAQRLFTGILEITQSLGGAKVNIAPKSPASPSENLRPDSRGPRES